MNGQVSVKLQKPTIEQETLAMSWLRSYIVF